MVNIGELSEEFQGSGIEDAIVPSELVNQEITIVEVEELTGQNGDFGLFTLEGKDKRLRTGGIFFKQMKRIKEANYFPVTGFLVAHDTGKGNPYYTLEGKLSEKEGKLPEEKVGG